MLQVALGGGGILLSLLLAWALVATTRRQTAHFRSLVTSSTDLVLVLSDGGCRYASGSVARLVGNRPEPSLLEHGFMRVRPRRRPSRRSARRSGAGERRSSSSSACATRPANGGTSRRTSPTCVTTGTCAGWCLNARDTTDRVRLEQELTLQAQRDNFGSQLVEALEMADEEDATYDVVRRAMEEVSAVTPMELLVSDSSRAHLEQAATNPSRRRPALPGGVTVLLRRGPARETRSSSSRARR